MIDENVLSLESEYAQPGALILVKDPYLEFYNLTLDDTENSNFSIDSFQRRFGERREYRYVNDDLAFLSTEPSLFQSGFQTGVRKKLSIDII